MIARREYISKRYLIIVAAFQSYHPSLFEAMVIHLLIKKSYIILIKNIFKCTKDSYGDIWVIWEKLPKYYDGMCDESN